MLYPRFNKDEEIPQELLLARNVEVTKGQGIFNTLETIFDASGLTGRYKDSIVNYKHTLKMSVQCVIRVFNKIKSNSQNYGSFSKPFVAKKQTNAAT